MEKVTLELTKAEMELLGHALRTHAQAFAEGRAKAEKATGSYLTAEAFIEGARRITALVEKVNTAKARREIY